MSATITSTTIATEATALLLFSCAMIDERCAKKGCRVGSGNRSMPSRHFEFRNECRKASVNGCEDSEICGATPGHKPVSQPSCTLILTLVFGSMVNPTSPPGLLGLGLLTAVAGLVDYFSISCACKQGAGWGFKRMKVEG